MIQLPSNVTVAALALLLGALLGAGTYHVLSPDEEPRQPAASTPIVELDRFLQPSDTTGEEEADQEIRYRTRTETRNVCEGDSVFVPVPTELSSEALYVSDSTPLQVGPDRVTWTAWDTEERRHEQRVYEVPDETFRSNLYALVEIRNPPRLGLPTKTRWGAGLGARFRYRKFEGRVEGTLSPNLRPELAAAILWRF